VSASALKEEQQEIFTAEMDDYIKKPFRVKEIYNCLARHLGLKFQHSHKPQEETTPIVLTSEMLSELPKDIRNEFSEALIALDNNKINALIKDIASIDTELANTLNHLSEYYDYQTILNALNELNTRI
jgi:DNA-binding response OmpR family regulator